MKKRLKTQKPIAIITLLAMALSLAMVPGGVARADEATSVPEWAVDDGTQGESSKFAELPATLDLREKELVTPVKQQSPWGTCWAFGAMSAAESGILADAGTTYEKSKLDLSERHLAWFAVHPVTEGVDPAQAGEGAYALRDGNDSFNTGGQNILVTTLFSQGVGPVTEQEFPYRGVDANGKSNTTEPSLPLEEFERDPRAGTLKVLAESNHKTESEIDALIRESAVADGISYEAEFKLAMDSARSLYEGIRYSGDDDWSIAPERRNVHSGLIIKDGNVLPSYREGDAVEPSAASVDAMKRELAQGRGILINYRADQARPGAASDGTYLNRDAWAQYTFENVDSNHAVCIVGWDDDYPASNFAHTVYQRQKDASGNYVVDGDGNYVVVRDAEGNPIVDEECTRLSTPPGNGAWIVKNSWGSETDTLVDDLGNVTGSGSYGIRDADGKATGYFYLSYHDRTISVPETMSFSSNLLGPTGKISIFQHDYMPAVGGFYSESSKDLMSSANVFDLAEADGDQVALSVGGRTFVPNQHVTFAVYQLNENASSPVDGKLLRRVSGTFEYAGYHRLDLDEDLPLRAGHRYSVVSTVSSREADGTVSYGVAANQGVSERIRRWQATVPKWASHNWVYTKAVVNPGESWMYKDGAWVDWSEHIAGLAAPDEPSLAPAGPFASYTDMLPVDNFSLKLYAEPADIPDVSYAVVEGDGSTWTKGSDADLPFTFKRFDEAETDDTTFSHFASASVDGNAIERDKDYAAAEGSVKVNLKPSYLGALSAGEHTITATFDDGTATAKFTVAEAPAPETPAADTTPTTGTTTTPTTGTTSLAKTADPTSFAAVAAAGVAGVTALVIGRRRKR